MQRCITRRALKAIQNYSNISSFYILTNNNIVVLRGIWLCGYLQNKPVSYLDKARNSKAVDTNYVSLAATVFSERKPTQRSAVINLQYHETTGSATVDNSAYMCI